MKELTKEKLAELLDGRDLRGKYDYPTTQEVEDSNLVVLYGRSDYLIEVRGAVYNSICIDGECKLALVLAGEEIDDEEDVTNMDIPAVLPLSDEYDQSDNPRLITVQYCSLDNTIADWEFDTVLPHATFLLNKEGKPFCKGIVIDIDEVEPVK